MGGFRIEGNTSGNVAEIDNNNNLNVTLPKVASQSGYARLMSEVDAGNVTGNAYLLPPETSEDFRLRVELDTIFDSHNFNETSQFTGKHKLLTTTMVSSWAGNAMTTNSGGITTINTGSLFQTYQYFPVFGGAETYAYFNVCFTGTWAVTNTNIDVGLFTAGTTTPYAPTDGVYLRANNTGIFGVSNFNGSEQSTPIFLAAAGGAAWSPVLGTFYDVIVTIGQNITVFWMDLRDGKGYVRMGSIADPAGASTPAAAQNLPFSVRHAIGGTAASAGISCKIGTYTISQGGFQNTRSEQITAAIMTGGQQGLAGHTQGSVALLSNNLAVGAGAAMTNTTAALGTGMGGQFTALPTLAVGTDGIVCSYQNPLPSASITGKQLVIKGVKISSFVSTVLAGNASPVFYLYSLAYGHTNVSLATTEGANAKAPRRIPLGQHSFAAAAPVFSTGGNDVYMAFDRAIPVNPGEFVAIAAKNVGAVTTSGAITFLVTYDWGWVN